MASALKGSVMRRFLIASALLCVAGAVAFWLLTIPRTIAAGDLPDYAGDPARGRYVFFAAGCASCHAAPGAKGCLLYTSPSPRDRS